jgi:hypothetical protein
MPTSVASCQAVIVLGSRDPPIFPFLDGSRFPFAGCQRESAAQSFEHGGSRSTAVASADTAVSNQSNFNGTAIASGRMLARQLMLAWLRATQHESGNGALRDVESEF